MAIIKGGSVATSASGALGGIVFSHNRGGQYIRSRTIPTNPNSAYQQAVRSAVAQLTSRWTNTLTPAQRAAWDLYALNVPLPNRLGDLINVGGLAMYVRSNVPRVQIAYAIVDAAPTTFDLGDYTAPVVAAPSEATQLVPTTIETTDDWANEDDAAMIVSTSRPMSPARNYFKGPYRYSFLVEGDSVSPPSADQSVTPAFAFVEGQKLGLRAIVTRADGRLSTPFLDLATCGA